MKVAVCTKNQDIQDIIRMRKDILSCFFANIEEIDVSLYDCIIVDLESCNGKMDVVRTQSRKTIYIINKIDENSIDKIIYDYGSNSDFTYFFGGQKYCIDLNNIMYFESDHKQIRAFYETGEFVRFYGKLDEVQRCVDGFGFFIRCNKSYLVNYNYSNMKSGYVEVYGERIQISRLYKKELKDRINLIKNM